MEAVVFYRGSAADGKPSRAEFVRTAPIPVPGPRQVRIRLAAASLNPVDGKFSIWESLLPPTIPEPFVIGVDGAGIVDEVGAEATPWAVGDRVVVHTWLAAGSGTFAQYCLAEAAACCRVPATVSLEDAAALPCAGWTAYKALVDRARMHPGSPGAALITSGNGGVGGFGVQIAAALGASPIIATCSAAAASRVRALGATHTIDYTLPAEVIVQQVKDITGGVGVRYLMDSVSSASVTSLLPTVAFEGHVCCIGGVAVRGGPGDTYFRGISVHDIALGPAAYRSGRPDTLATLGDELFQLVAAGKVAAMVEHKLALQDVPAALMDTASRRGGKTVVVIAPSVV